MTLLIALLTVLSSVSPVLNDLNNRYHQCLEKASELKQLVEPGKQTLDGKAMTVGLRWNSSFLLFLIVFMFVPLSILVAEKGKRRVRNLNLKRRGQTWNSISDSEPTRE